MKKLLPLLALLLLCAGCGILDVHFGTQSTTVTLPAAAAATTTATTVTLPASTAAVTTTTTKAVTTPAMTTTAPAASSSTFQTTTTADAPATTAATTAATPWEDPYPAGLRGWIDVPAYLVGDWWLQPGGLPERSKNTMLFFRDDDGILGACVMHWSDGGSVTAHADLSDLGEPDGDACDVLTLSVANVTSSFSADYEAIEASGSSDYQILAAIVDGQDVLALRELGNGESLFAMDVLGYENAAAERLWVFRRDSMAGAFAPTEAQYEQMRARNRTFYAYCWQQSAAGCFLQEVTVEQSTIDWYGEGRQVMRVLWLDNGHAMTAVRYDSAVPFEAPQTAAKSAVPALQPKLVQVTVDNWGVVTKLEEVPYMAYGYYFRPGIR